MINYMWRVFVAVAVLVMAAPAWAESYVVFDVPGATQGIGSIRMNDRGDISGQWFDAASVGRGFVRSAAGAISSYEVPGAVTTTPTAISDSGVVVGYWSAADGMPHGFVRTPDGRVTPYDVAGSDQTTLRAINSAGDITGVYRSGTTGSSAAFVLQAGGTLTSFAGASPFAINDLGDTAGQAGVEAFVRTSDGTLATFNLPGAAESGMTTRARAINRDGTSTGYSYKIACGPGGNYCVAAGARSFVRSATGTLSVFTVQRAGRDVSTQALGINASGTVVGIASLGTYAAKGFIREPGGTITSFDVPGMSTTTASAINDAGMIAGVTTDASGVRGFLRLP